MSRSNNFSRSFLFYPSSLYYCFTPPIEAQGLSESIDFCAFMEQRPPVMIQIQVWGGWWKKVGLRKRLSVSHQPENTESMQGYFLGQRAECGSFYCSTCILNQETPRSLFTGTQSSISVWRHQSGKFWLSKLSEGQYQPTSRRGEIFHNFSPNLHI